MKKLIYLSLFMLVTGFGFSQNNETINNGKIIGSFELGSKEVTTILDETTGCVRVSSPHTTGLFVPNENVELVINEDHQMVEVRKPSLFEQVFANKQCKETSDRILTDEQIEEIGRIHNESLELAFTDFDFGVTNKTQELKERMIKVSNEHYNIDSLSWLSTELDLDNNMNILSQNLSQEAMEIINLAIEESYSITSVEDFQLFIRTLENTSRLTLDGKELDFTLVTLCVLRYSAAFWSPTAIGGTGIGEEILELAKPPKHGWLAADGAAAGGGMIGAAVSAGLATGPVGWGFLVGVGVGAGIASGWYALTN